MSKKRILINRFNTWTEILKYLDNISKEYSVYNIKYKVDIFYSEIFNGYKIRVEV
jgi:hypothetical protein